ncbi:hypothetical protein [Nocardiopsis sp. MG754419]|uniref:hypothetical protein n=1 Tax=Nocardiopsis sp. MG754419 TaxID=2259865 RepID=UPI001BA6CEDB|nr:hypothetical protein [Nocardiopsis sp. MG754419]MBR8745027.1 hypothetical protein [Nocardiopsis sp. MG754419]
MAPVTRNRGRRGGRFAFAAVGTIMALGLAGCSLGGGDEAEEPDTETAEPVDAAPLLEEALAALAEYPAVVASGQIAASVGADVQETELTVADGGATRGTFQVNGTDAEVLAADGKLFLRADEEFWLDQSVFGPDSDDFEGNWVRSSPALAGLNPSATLAPPALAETLGAMELEDDEAVEENLDGTRAYRIGLAGERNQVWIDAETNRILRIAIEELVPEDAETGPQVRLDLAEAETAEVEELYTGLTTATEEELTSSRDARVQAAWDGEAGMSCDEGPSCTWSGTVQDTGGENSSGTVLVRMDVTFNNDELGGQECSESGALEAGGTLDLSCGVDYDVTSSDPEEYSIDADAVLSTRGLTSSQQEEMLAAITEQREATLSGPEEDATEESADDGAEDGTDEDATDEGDGGQ